MKIVNSISGGKTSGYIAANIKADYNIFSLVCTDDNESRPKDKSLTNYTNHKLEKFIPEFGEFIATTEDDATIKAMIDLEQTIGENIIWVRGKSFDDVIDLAGMRGVRTMLPNKHFRYCTEEMKLLPIFNWWLHEIGERCKMNIGFRFDEFARVEKFMNKKPNEFKIPVSCRTKGRRLQRHENFNWRFCSFPLVKLGITENIIKDYWKARHIQFPVVSNCVGCFHKKPETLCTMAAMHPEKMQWFAEQENKNKGTWIKGINYNQLIANSKNWIPEMIKENTTCDSGGCTD